MANRRRFVCSHKQKAGARPNREVTVGDINAPVGTIQTNFGPKSGSPDSKIIYI